MMFYPLMWRFLHWSSALLLLMLFFLGQYMVALPDGDVKWGWYDWHKSFGLLFFCLLILRMLWRTTRQAPAYANNMSTFLITIASMTHLMMYLVMLVLPISGYIDSAAGGYHIAFFNLFDIPKIIEKDKLIAEYSLLIHVLAGYFILVLLGLHASAALFHQFILRDGLLYRMLPLRMFRQK